MRRRTIHEWIETGQLDRDLSTGGAQDSPRLDPSRGIIDSRLTDAVGNGWGEPSWSRCPPTAPAPPHDASRTRRRFVSSSTRVNVDLHVYVLAEFVEHGHQPVNGEAAKLHVTNAGKVRVACVTGTVTSPWCCVQKMHHTSDMETLTQDTDLRSRLLARVAASPDEVWAPSDFADLGSRAAVDKTLQRLAAAGELRRIDRGLYDRPRRSGLTGRPTVPDYRAVIRAVTRRDQVRAVIDGMTAANDLGLTTAVPARIEVLIDARLKPIKLGSQEIHFKFAAPSRLHWAGRPAMRVVQALHWMQDMLSQDSERRRVQAVLLRLLADPRHGQTIRDDLRAGFSALPIWMQEFLRDLLGSADVGEVPR